MSVTVLGVTVSKEQVSVARETYKGLPVEIRLQDYRDLHGEFDRVFSLGMFEHVGYKNWHLIQESYDEGFYRMWKYYL
ncbi:MAG: class I SAM-dependent methyltransferase [Cyanobacteria bacterium P01_F01_bin.53]